MGIYDGIGTAGDPLLADSVGPSWRELSRLDRPEYRELLEEQNNGAGAAITIAPNDPPAFLLRYRASASAPPQNTIVMLSPELADPSQSIPANPTTRLVALVRWQTSRGGSFASVDIARATVFSVTAALSLEVYVGYSPGGGPQTGATWRVEGTATRGATTSTRPARSSRVIGLVANGGTSQRVAIPQFATRVRLLSDQATSRVSTTVNFFADNAGGNVLYGFDAGEVEEEVITSGAEFISVTNRSPQALLSLSYELFL